MKSHYFAWIAKLIALALMHIWLDYTKITM
jgi:hypothetical protein